VAALQALNLSWEWARKSQKKAVKKLVNQIFENIAISLALLAPIGRSWWPFMPQIISLLFGLCYITRAQLILPQNVVLHV
jgi:hypothetical protein